MTNFIVTLLNVVVDLQQLHIKTPIRFSIVGVREFAWYRTQGHTRIATRSFSFVGRSRISKRKPYEAL